jgi:hypothetical protein
MRSWTLIALTTAFVLGAPPGWTQDYQISWSSINSGGGTQTGGAIRLDSSIGQAVAGYAEGSGRRHWIGFWHPATGVTPEMLPRLDAAKTLPDGRYVGIAGKIATSGTPDFGGFFYLEEADRSSGIRISVPFWPVPGLMEGSIVQVTGVTGTTPDGERQIVASYVIVTSSAPPLAPLGMIQRAIGGGDFGTPPLGQYGVTGGTGVNTIGLLIRAWGTVTETGTGYVVLDDGSGRPLRVDTSTLPVPPATGSFVTITGISSLKQGGSPTQRLPLLLPRRGSDVNTP